MEKLILKGRYSTYSNPQRSNIPIEEKRDIREDASWCYKGLIETKWPQQQFEDIYYEHLQRRDTISSRDILLKQRGFPTHPITRALLEAECQQKIKSTIKNSYQYSWKEFLVSPSLNVSPHQRVSLVNRIPLQDMTDDQLMSRVFIHFNLFSRKYAKKIEGHFRQNTGLDLPHRIEEWNDTKSTNMLKLTNVLRQRIKELYSNGKSNITLPLDVTKELQKVLCLARLLLSVVYRKLIWKGI